MKLFFYFFLITILIFTKPASASIDSSQSISAKNCPNLLCVRNNIDAIDSEIIKLIGLRLTYVQRAAELKKNKQPIHDQTRENQIILKVTQLALKDGYPGSIAAEIYKTLLIQTNIYEQQMMQKKDLKKSKKADEQNAASAC